MKGLKSAVQIVPNIEDSRYKVKNIQAKVNLSWWKPNSTLKGHQDAVTRVSISSDGQYIVSGSGDKTVKVWNMSTGECVKTLEGHDHSVSSVSISPDGQYIVSGSIDKTVKVWNMSSGECVKTLVGHQQPVTSVSISPDGQYIVSGSWDETVRVWSMSTGECVKTLEGHQGGVACVSISPDGQYIVTGIWDKKVKVWSMSTGECVKTLEGHQQPVTGVSISPDGQYIVSGSIDKTMKIWNMSSGECVKTLEGHQGNVIGVSISPDGQYIVSGGSVDKTVKVWSMSTGECVKTLEGHQGSVTGVSISPDGQYIVSGSQDKTVRVWNMSRGECVKTLEGHQGSVTSVSISPDGQYIVSGCQDKKVRVWNMSTGECVKTLEGHLSSVMGVSISPDGQYIVSAASVDKTVKVWNMSSGECVKTLEGHQGGVACVSISPDGQYIVSCSVDKTVKVWSMSTGECVKTLEGHQDGVTGVSISPDGQYIVSGGGWDKTMKVWSMSTGECVKTLGGHPEAAHSVSFSPDGQYIVSSGGSWDKKVRVWNMSTGECVKTLEGHQGGVSSVSISPDGQYIVSGSEDKTVKVWSMSTGECVKTLEGHLGGVTGVSISPDGQYIVSGSWDKTVRIFRDYLYRYQCTVSPSFDKLPMVSEYCFSSILIKDDGVSTTTYLNRLIESNGADNEITQIFNECKPSAWNNIFHETTFPDGSHPSNIIDLLIDHNREVTLKIVLDQILFGFHQHNQVRTGQLTFNKAIWRVTPAMSTPSFTRSMCRLITRFPQLAEYFLSEVGSVKTYVEVDAHDGLPKRVDGLLCEHVVKLTGRISSECGFGVVGRSNIDVAAAEDIFFSVRAPSNDIDHIESRMLPFVDAGGDPAYPLHERSIFHAILNSGHPGLYQNATFRTLVQYKWQTFGMKLFVRKMMISSIGLLLLMLLLFVRPDPSGHPSSAQRAVTVVVSVLMLAESLWTFSREVVEFCVLNMQRYFEDWKNYVDLAVMVLSWITGVGVLAEWKHHVVFLALALFLKWLGLLYFLQVFSSTGALVRMVFQIIVDMRHFLLIMFIALSATGSAFYALLHHSHPDDIDTDNPFRSPGHTLFFMFNMLLLGDFDTASFVFGEYAVLVQVLFVLSMIFTLIILLNLLIALMSDSYERIQDQSELAVLELRARALQSLEVFLSHEDRSNPEYFPRYYYLLLPKGDGRMNDLSSEDQWNGVLNALKAEIHNFRDLSEQQMEKIEKNVCDLQNLLGKSAENQNRKIEKLEAQCENILQLLRQRTCTQEALTPVNGRELMM